MPSLSDKLLGAKVKSAFPGGDDFLPEKALHEIITNDAVLKALRPSQKHIENDEEPTSQELVDYTLENAKRVFAIVVYVFDAGPKRRRAMQQIMSAKFGDRNLPVEKHDLENKFHDSVSPFNDESDSEDEEASTWNLTKIDLFYTLQWQYIAPVFSTDRLHNDLAEQSILPFTRKIAEPQSGAFGQVTGYEVHPSHFVDSNFENHGYPQVAVKKIHGQDGDRPKMISSWERELNILRMMNQLKQPHIVRFLTAFRCGSEGHEEHYLVLEWADGGNLRQFWNTFKRPALTAELVKATVHQILGLAEALNTAHNPIDPKFKGLNFRHGDLRPENILHFRNDKGAEGIGTFKIGDWGLAKQHNAVTVLRNVNTSTAWGTRAYEPPEEASSQGGSLIIPGQRLKKRSRLYDVWSMGCITLEFLIWLAYGAEELRRFHHSLAQTDPENVRFYHIRQKTGNDFSAEVHPVVDKWMEHMAKSPIFQPGETAMGNILEIIKTCLLVVNLPQRLGTVDFSSEVGLGGGRSLTHNVTIGSSAMSSTTVSRTTQRPPEILVSEAVNTPREDKNIEPVVQRQFKTGPERNHSKHFCDRMHEMTGEEFEANASYWFTGQPEPATGPDDDESIAPPQKAEGYETSGSGSGYTNTGTEQANPARLGPVLPVIGHRTEKVLPQPIHGYWL